MRCSRAFEEEQHLSKGETLQNDLAQRVYVLGAGASHFAGFPLGKDLLSFLKAEWESTRDLISRELGGYFLDFVEMVRPTLPMERILSNGEPDLEFLLSLTEGNRQNGCDRQLHACLIEDIRTVTNKVDISAWDFTRVRLGFAKLVTAAFTYKSYEIANQSECQVPSDVINTSLAWTELVKPGDILITFNWDLLQEVLLSKAGKWTCDDGYGIRISPFEPPNYSPSIILKLHGSCNWALSHKGDSSLHIDYRNPLFYCAGVGSEPSRPLGSTSDYGTSLIIPSYLKDPGEVAVLSPVWQRAHEALKESTDLVVIGYSLPGGDGFAQKFIENALSKNRSLNQVMIVLDGDNDGFRRWQALCNKVQKNWSIRRHTFEEYVTNPA